MKQDQLTHLITKAIDNLFLQNLKGTSLGILLGVIVTSAQDFIALYFPKFGTFGFYGFIAVGVLICNIFCKKKYEDPKIELMLTYTRQIIKEGNFSEAEQRRIWRKVIDAVISEYSHDADTTDTADAKKNNDNSHNPTPE